MSANMSKSHDGPVPYSEHMRTIIENGILHGKLPKITTDPDKLEAQAKEAMNKNGFEYIYGSAGARATADANRRAFQQWRIIPRMLQPTNPRDLSVTLFGQKYNAPILMAPIGVQALYHKDKEVGTVKACEAVGVPFCLSTASSSSIEEVAEACPSHPKWFQLYWPLDEDITASLLQRAKASGYQVLVVTLDAWTVGWRALDLDSARLPFLVGQGDQIGFTDPVFRTKFAEKSGGKTPEDSTAQAALQWTFTAFPGVSHSWEDLETLKKHWDGPIVIKGIQHVEDAKLAVEHGMDGIVVSNHGGRQIDGCIGSLEALPEIVDAVGDQITVLFDSGVRTGADIVKALALGAKAVLVGRPVVYGLGIDGKEGAQAVLAGLLAEVDVSMGLAGMKSVSSLTRKCLKGPGPLPGWYQ